MTAGNTHSSSAYGTDLAMVHDVGFGGFANGIAPEFIMLLDRYGFRGETVVDLGCGSGIVARHLVDSGCQVVGVDISPAMIELARRRVPEATFHVDSFRRFPLPDCAAVTAFGEVLAYQFDAASRPRGLKTFFRKVHSSLRPGGLFVFDLPEVGLDCDRPPTWSEGDDWTCLVRFETDTRRDQLVRHIVTFVRDGTHFRRQQEVHRVQLFRSEEVTSQLRSCGFRVQRARRLGAFPMLAGRVLFTARKAPDGVSRSRKSPGK